MLLFAFPFILRLAPTVRSNASRRVYAGTANSSLVYIIAQSESESFPITAKARGASFPVVTDTVVEGASVTGCAVVGVPSESVISEPEVSLVSPEIVTSVLFDEQAVKIIVKSRTKIQSVNDFFNISSPSVKINFKSFMI